jgi:hypothetical protein
MKKIHIFEAKGINKGTWIWCLHCERCYQAGEYREIDNLQMCPYEDCDGDTVLDSWLWKEIQEKHPKYPEIPERNKEYPMYN